MRGMRGTILRSCTIAFAIVAASRAALADSQPTEFFARGWDLFQILPGTQYRDVDFLGEPIGSFHFSDNLTDSGTHATGNAAIITRRDDAVIDIETEGLDRAVALQLASVRD